MFNIFHKSKVEFICLIPEVARQMPIEPAKKVNYTWTKLMSASLADMKSKLPLWERVRHIAKCPGIATVTNHGFIQKTYQDIFIKTNGSKGFEWKTALDQTILMQEPLFKYPYIGHHILENSNSFGILKPNTLSTVIKIQSPWVVKIPKGYYLLCMPIPYNDDNRFTASIGLLDGDAGINWLNVQLFWHCLNSEELIPAGTPIAQYILIKKDKINYTVREANANNLTELKQLQLILDSSFSNSNYGKLKQNNKD